MTDFIIIDSERENRSAVAVRPAVQRLCPEHDTDSGRTKLPSGHYRFMSQAIAVLPDPSFSTLSPGMLKATAKAAKLRYVSDRSRGIRRERTGDHFDYFDAHGAKIIDEEEVTRIPSWQSRSACLQQLLDEDWVRPEA